MINSKNTQFVIKEISTINLTLNPGQSNLQIVSLIKDKSNVDFVGLFFIDFEQHLLSFKAGSGDIGQKIVNMGWNLPLDGKNIWTNAIHLKEIRLNNWLEQTSFGCSILSDTQIKPEIELQVRNETFPAPLSPDMIWQLCLPLQHKKEILGLLEIQCFRKETSFNQDNIKNFWLVAESIAKRIARGEV